MACKEFYIDVDGKRVHAKLDRSEDTERGPLAIVFHGFTGHMEERHIVAVAEGLRAEGVSTLRVDLYGHGKSDGAFADHTLYKWVTQGLAVIDYARGLDFVDALYVAGHSQGGLLSMLLAGMCPDDVAALMPLSPAILIPEAARQGVLLGCPFDPVHIPATIGVGERTLSGNYARVAQTIHVEDEIDRYPGPVLIVHGSADEGVPLSDSEAAVARYRNARLVVIPDDDHCYHQHLDQAVAAVREFVAAL